MTIRNELVRSRCQHGVCALVMFATVLLASPCRCAENNKGLGLPSATAAANDSAKRARIELGQKIFFDARLSASGDISCASCHKPERAFSDGLPVPTGVRGSRGTRNAPSLLNAMFNNSQFWDGRRKTLEDQALDPFVNRREHGLSGQQALIALIKRDPNYVDAFYRAFHVSTAHIEPRHVAEALASFERTLVAGNSLFDRYYFKGEKAALSVSAERGLRLFQGVAQCSTCHTIEEHYALFTDHQFHSLSVGFRRIEKQLDKLTVQLVELRGKGISLDQIVFSNKNIAELGRFAVTLEPGDIGRFRTPSLRNVELTAPYMHDGSVPTLEQAVDLEIYYRGTETGHPLILTPNEKDDLVAFLKSLTSPHANQ